MSHIRWLIRADMPAVLRIEAASFGDPWRKGDFIRALRQRNTIGLVVEAEETAVGFVIYELHKDRLRIVNLAVDPTFRKLGFGRLLVEKLIGKLHPKRRSRITLEIRERNLGGQLFFRSLGFRAERVLRGFFETDSESEDAYLMEYRAGRTARPVPIAANRLSRYFERGGRG